MAARLEGLEFGYCRFDRLALLEQLLRESQLLGFGRLRVLGLQLSAARPDECEAPGEVRRLKRLLEKRRTGWQWMRYALMGWFKRPDGLSINPDCQFRVLSWHVMIKILQSLEDFVIRT